MHLTRNDVCALGIPPSTLDTWIAQGRVRTRETLDAADVQKQLGRYIPHRDRADIARAARVAQLEPTDDE